MNLICVSAKIWMFKCIFPSLSHKLCYILHPFVGFISVIFTTARRADEQLWQCSESVSMFYLKSSLSQQQLFYQPVCLSTYFIKNKPTRFSVPTSLSYSTCWSAASEEQEGPPHLPVQNPTIDLFSDWPGGRRPSHSPCCNSTPDGFRLCLN